MFLLILFNKWAAVAQLRRQGRPLLDLVDRNLSSCQRVYATKKPKPVPSNEIEGHAERLSALLEVTQSRAKLMLVAKPRLARLSDEDLSTYMSILKKHEIEYALWHYPDLIKIAPQALDNYILILKEMGIDHHDVPNRVLSYNSLKHYLIEDLKRKGIISPSSKLVQNSIEALNLDRSYVPDLLKHLPDDIDKMSMLEFRTAVLTFYLSVVFKVDLNIAKKRVDTNKRLPGRCFSWISRVIKILQETYKLPISLIRRQGYLLCINPDELLRISELPSLGGVPVIEFAQIRPKILAGRAEQLLKIDNLLKDHGFTPTAIAIIPEIYTLCYKTIAERLEVMKSTPELAVLQSHPRALRLIYYQRIVLQRLKIYRDLNVLGPLPGLNVLAGATKYFVNVVSRTYVCRGTDVLIYLSHALGKTKDEVRQKLLEHPFWLFIQLTSIKEAFDYLHEYHHCITQSTIFNALPIVLYPKDIIEKSIETAIETEGTLPTEPNFLHMVLYFLEKECHFTGNGVWGQLKESDPQQPSTSTNQDFKFEEELDETFGPEEDEAFELEDGFDLDGELVHGGEEGFQKISYLDIDRVSEDTELTLHKPKPKRKKSGFKTNYDFPDAKATNFLNNGVISKTVKQSKTKVEVKVSNVKENKRNANNTNKI